LTATDSSVVPKHELSQQRPWKRIKYAILLFLYAFAFVIWTLDIASFVGGALSPATMSQACQAIIQFDSFITAGWTVGFFYFWGMVTRESNTLKEESYIAQQAMISTNLLFEKGVKELGSAIGSIPGPVPENIRRMHEANENSIQTHSELAAGRKKRMAHLFLTLHNRTNALFYYAMGTFAAFVGGALLAIVGILMPDRYLVISSLGLLVIGILLTLTEWANLQAFGARLSKARIGTASVTKETDQVKEQIEDIREEVEEIKQDVLELQDLPKSLGEKAGPRP